MKDQSGHKRFFGTEIVKAIQTKNNVAWVDKKIKSYESLTEHMSRPVPWASNGTLIKMPGLINHILRTQDALRSAQKCQSDRGQVDLRPLRDMDRETMRRFRMAYKDSATLSYFLETVSDLYWVLAAMVCLDYLGGSERELSPSQLSYWQEQGMYIRCQREAESFRTDLARTHGITITQVEDRGRWIRDVISQSGVVMEYAEERLCTLDRGCSF